MKVDDLEINEITFGQERQLYNKYKKAYAGSEVDYEKGEIKKINMDWEAHDESIAIALDFAFDEPEKILKGMSHPEIDLLAQRILTKYLRLGDESGKE